MTVKNASEYFGISERKIRELCTKSQSENIEYIRAVKRKGRWNIDDNTTVILEEYQIQNILLSVLKVKNNSHCAISQKFFSTEEELNIVVKYLTEIGFATNFNEKLHGYKNIFKDLQITDEGFNFLINKINTAPKININILNVNNSLVPA